MRIGTLSIVIPVFNEQETIVPVLRRVLEVQLPRPIRKEIIVVDDASTDQSASRIRAFLQESGNGGFIHYERHTQNTGKGGALQTGIRLVTGDYMIVQDADLELDPADFNQLIQPILADEADVVYGSRFTERAMPKGGSWLSFAANRLLTRLSNFFFGTRLTDMETCYKLMPVAALKKIRLLEMRFGFEPEITAKLARNKSLRFAEVPVTYEARSGLQGKKIGWKDGFRALYCIFKYGVLKF